jgi:pimeloyl-ACP methyl ester carboxylesterase
MKNLHATLLACAAATLLSACATVAPSPEISREHDKRNAFVPASEASFAAMANMATATDRWAGVLGGAGYRIEVPKANWNGKLAVFAHGYAGTGNNLTVTDPQIRRYLIDNGFAWAASSYSKNYYDVRAGVEDTNALVLAFNSIAASNGRVLAAPTRTYLFGRSMGGHIAAAAIEAEALATARSKVRYDGAVPMCGVLGDTELFDHFAAYQLAAQQLAGLPATKFPATNWAQISADVRSTLFNSGTSFATPTAQGARLKTIVMHLTGGPRPIFDEGFANESLQKVVWDGFGRTGDVAGILSSNKNVIDTNRIRYRFDAPDAVVDAFNASIVRSTADVDANPLRRDGVRWIPKVHGEFSIPVLTLHTLGDMYVPFMMEQIYRQRAAAKGNSANLVQRAIRAPGHCDFTVAEQATAFADLVKWVETGVKPAGDDVVTASVIAKADYGCAHTDNSLGPDDGAAVRSARAAGKLPACPVPK